MVIRGFLTGHAWREYKQGKRTICGVKMPDGMKENQAFPNPIITPTTKADKGHDQDISRDEILKLGIVSEDDYTKLETYTRLVFQKGTELAKAKGLILVDTKYEFGKKNDQIYLIDEIHTPDSSRYFYSNEYLNRLENNLPQKQLSKEFVREWLMKSNFSGEPDQILPAFTEDIIQSISDRYIELYEKITGKPFVKAYSGSSVEKIEKNCLKFLQNF
jgi:phosphoribosylaminoimidazole-succinocarboxamide synthase